MADPISIESDKPGLVVDKGLLKGGSAALAIKLAAATFSYLLLVVLARILSDHEYGEFAFGLSLASLLALIAGLGQQTAILRFWPQYTADNRPDLAMGALFFGYSGTMVGGMLTVILAIGVLFLLLHFAVIHEAEYLFAAAVLTLPLALADFQASAMRASGSIVTALLPRDVLWRFAVLLVVITAVTRGSVLTGSIALWISGSCLTILVLVQTIASFLRPIVRISMEAHYERAKWAVISIGLWGTAIVGIVPQVADVIVVGTYIDSETAGQYFVALKVASLLSLPLIAANMVGAPLIARYFHSNENRKLQFLCNRICLTLAVPSMAGFVLFVWFGEEILGVFGPSYAQAKGILVILALGNVVNAFCGPSGFLLALCGFERSLLKIQTATAAGLVAGLLVLVPAFGDVGAAVASTVAMVTWNIWARRQAVKGINIDPTIIGLILTTGRAGVEK